MTPGTTSAPGYSLRRIAAGAHDASCARSPAPWRRTTGPVLLRFAHEMNADWYPWGVVTNGNTPAHYVRRLASRAHA